MSEIVYSQSKHPEMTEGRSYENPRLFTGVRSDAKKVIIVGSYPGIAEAYRAADVEVVEVDKEVAVAQTQAIIAEGRALTPLQRASLVIPEDYKTLPWTQKGDSEGLTLRGLASSLSDEPVLNKEQALTIIAEEVERRTPPSQEA